MIPSNPPEKPAFAPIAGLFRPPTNGGKPMLTRRRYRINFSVQFDHDIEADGPETARFVADDMARNAWPPLIGGMLEGDSEIRCAWSTITPLGEVGDDPHAGG